MTTSTQRLHDLTARVEDAKTRRARAEAAHDAAHAAETTLLTALTRDYGITTVAQATDVLAGLKTRLAQQLDELETALDEAERT